ncbi:MAG TPA: YicC family protein [Candidatus Copromonas avistercoris]|nr:YicC family protein [Candidatus Copromonas avistercoris]
MINSMTGFGRYESITEEYRISVEIKAVNHRYLDLGIKMPKKLNGFEAAMRTLLKDYIQRGKVDVFITYESYTEANLGLRYNSVLAGEYVEAFRKMSEQFGIPNDLTASVLARCPEVLSMEQEPEDETQMWELLKEALSKAAERFVESRRLEGEHLKADLLCKLDQVLSFVEFVETRSPGVVEEYRRRLEDKVRELLESSAIDDSRIAAEVTIFADKICVDEETVRLRSHAEGMKKELLTGGAVGRKLDFIAQEMNREANTILSKSNDREVTDHAILLKTEIEKIREQIQNIE